MCASYRGPGAILPLPSSLQNGTRLVSLTTERNLALGIYIAVKEVSAMCLGGEAEAMACDGPDDRSQRWEQSGVDM